MCWYQNALRNFFSPGNLSGIFQRFIESVLQGIPNGSVYIDDILVTGSTEEEHLENLSEVLNRLGKAGLKVNMNKCKLLAPT